MKFTLIFDQELPANGSPRDKWRIRKALHPQLAELWREDPVLAQLAKSRVSYTVDQYLNERPDVRRESFGEQTEPGKLNYCAPIKVKGVSCIPLVRASLDLACTLNILFLRKGRPGNVILESGDIDNRLKTLFDGLRMPSQDEVNGIESKNGELPQPLYCVLEQDALINDFSVRTARRRPFPTASSGHHSANAPGRRA